MVYDASPNRFGAPVGMPRILAELADGTLGDDELDAVVDWLTVTGDEEPPSWLVNRAVRIAGQHLGKDAPRPAIWRRLVAALVYDNRLQPRTMGARPSHVSSPGCGTRPAAWRSTWKS